MLGKPTKSPGGSYIKKGGGALLGMGGGAERW